MYVATADGHVKKISILPRTQETCVVEVWRASPPNNADSHILALRYLKETDSVSIFYFIFINQKFKLDDNLIGLIIFKFI